MKSLEEIQQELDENGIDCPMCELSSDIMVLGALGWRLHMRCRGCGADFSCVIRRDGVLA